MRMIFQTAFAVMLLASTGPAMGALSSAAAPPSREAGRVAGGAEHRFPLQQHGAAEDGAAAATRPQATDPPQASATWGAEFNLLDQLLLAVRLQNYTGVMSLLSPTGSFTISGFSCEPMTPAEIVAAVQAAPIRARWFEIGSWAGNEAGALFTVQSAAVVGPAGGPLENATAYVPSFYTFVSATADGTQIRSMSMVQSTADRQNNATSMLRVWERLQAAWLVGDVSTYDAVLAAGFGLVDFPAWKQFPASVTNRSAALTNLQEEFSLYPTRQMFQRAAFVACNLVVTDDVVSVVGPAHVGLIRRVMALAVTPDMQVSSAQRFFMTVAV